MTVRGNGDVFAVNRTCACVLVLVSAQVALPLGSKLDSSSLAYGAALLAEAGTCLEGNNETVLS